MEVGEVAPLPQGHAAQSDTHSAVSEASEPAGEQECAGGGCVGDVTPLSQRPPAGLQDTRLAVLGAGGLVRELQQEGGCER